MIISKMEMWGMFFWAVGFAASRNGVAGAEVIRPKFDRRRACDKFCAGTAARWCICGYAKHAHAKSARELYWCSSCGTETDFAVSHCDQHRRGA